MIPKQVISGLLLEELQEELESLGEERYRAKQILTWIHRRNARSFDIMTDISRDLREKLSRKYEIISSVVLETFVASDGTEKFLIKLSDKNIIESVLIRDDKRITVCISTQVGCPIGCLFCASGLDGFRRNLSTCEIVEQVLHIKGRLKQDEWISNLVVMGIGEPFLNFENLLKALKIFKADWGLGIGYNKTTVSTIGIRIERLKKLIEMKVVPNIAFSLHAPNDRVRALLVPKLDIRISEIIKAGIEYKRLTKKNVTFEYVLLPGINSAKKYALQLGKRLRGTKCKVNIIPYNKLDNLTYSEPTGDEIGKFVNILGGCGVPITVRKRKGSDITAACGQLRARFTKTNEK
jgi:23S rRNA (adenine2503-C2)-methyltransferase